MQRGLTLIELIILITLLVGLGVAGWYLLNPMELKARESDSLRLADLAILTQAINKSVELSVAAERSALCDGQASCEAQSHQIFDNYRKVNGEGWVKVDLTTQKSTPLPILPVDPINSDNLHFSFKSDGVGWEINAILESELYKVKMESDGGDNDNKYEVGTNLTLIN